MSMVRLVLGNGFAVWAAIVISHLCAIEVRAAEVRAAEGHTLVIYQVGDLVLNVHDYPYPSESEPKDRWVIGGKGGMGGMGMGGTGGGGTSNSPSEPGSVGTSDRITMEDLKKAVTSMVEPPSWDPVGPGSIGQLGTALLVSQTADVHRQIQDFLKQLREGTGECQTVEIDARWLLLDSDELDQLIPPNQEGRQEVDRKVLAAFTRRPTSFRGLTKCFSGQLVYLVGGTLRNVVTSYIPVVGRIESPHQPDEQYASLKGDARYTLTQLRGPGDTQSGTFSNSGRNVGYQPIVDRPNLGILLEIGPTVVAGEETAIVDLRSTFTMPGEQSANSVAQQPPAVDRIAIEMQQLATTLRVPLGRPVLVGGLTYMPALIDSLPQETKTDAGEPQQARAETPQFYLILELRQTGVAVHGRAGD